MKVYAKQAYTVKNEGSKYPVYFMQETEHCACFETLNEAIGYILINTI